MTLRQYTILKLLLLSRYPLVLERMMGMMVAVVILMVVATVVLMASTVQYLSGGG